MGDYLPGLLVASTPFAGWGFFNIGNTFSFTSSYIFCLLAIGNAFLVTNRSKTGAIQFRKLIGAPLLVTTLISILPMIFWEYGDYMKFAMSYLHLLFWMISVDALLRGVSDINFSIQNFLKCYLAVAIFAALIGLYDFYLRVLYGAGLPITFNVRDVEMPSDASFLALPRSASIFFEPGWYAHYILICMIIVLLWMIPDAKRRKKTGETFFLWVSSAILGVAVITTLSASALLVGFLTFLFAIFSKPRPFRAILIFISILFIASQIPLPGDLSNPLTILLDRFYGLFTGDWIPGESAESRTAEFQEAYNLLLRSNFFGIGYGQSAFFVTSIAIVGTKGLSSFYTILLAETGVIGFSIFIMSLIALNIKLFKLNKDLELNSSLGNALFAVRCVLFAECIYLNFISNFASSYYVTSIWLIFYITYLATKSISTSLSTKKIILGF